MPLLQFEKDDTGKAEAQKLQAMSKAYSLQGLIPKPDIKPHIQEAIAKVLCPALLDMFHWDKGPHTAFLNMVLSATGFANSVQLSSSMHNRWTYCHHSPGALVMPTCLFVKTWSAPTQ